MGKVAGRFIILLNLAHVLALDELTGLAGTDDGAVPDDMSQEPICAS